MATMDELYAVIEDMEAVEAKYEARIAALESENTALRLDIDGLSREASYWKEESMRLWGVVDSLLRLPEGVA